MVSETLWILEDVRSLVSFKWLGQKIQVLDRGKVVKTFVLKEGANHDKT